MQLFLHVQNFDYNNYMQGLIIRLFPSLNPHLVSTPVSSAIMTPPENDHLPLPPIPLASAPVAPLSSENYTAPQTAHVPAPETSFHSVTAAGVAGTGIDSGMRRLEERSKPSPLHSKFTTKKNIIIMSVIAAVIVISVIVIVVVVVFVTKKPSSTENSSYSSSSGSPTSTRSYAGAVPTSAASSAAFQSAQASIAALPSCVKSCLGEIPALKGTSWDNISLDQLKSLCSENNVMNHLIHLLNL
jgi:hypothetical protein